MREVAVISLSAVSPCVRPRPLTGGFTLLEVMVSMAASVIVIGALLMSSMSLHRALNSTTIYADAYSDQRRVTDYVGRDLRRAVAVGFTDDSGARFAAAGTTATVLLGGPSSLILSLPAYYQSNTRGDAAFETPLDVVASAQGLDYGTVAGLAPPVEAVYRKVFSAKENCVCFIREEAGTAEVIVRKAENLFVEVTIAGNGQGGTIKTWFRSSQVGPAPLVSTFDRLLLRNPPLNYQP